MKKIELKDYQMDRIIELRRRGFTWMGIQREVKVDRRIAQRTFIDWEKNQSVEELKEARQQLALEEYRLHRDSILQFAEHFREHLDIPRVAYMSYDADAYLDILLNKDLGYSERITGIKRETNNLELINKQVKRHNVLLFRALREHTAKAVRWGVLEDWKNSWNNCINNVPRLEMEAETLISHHRSQMFRKEISMLERIKARHGMKPMLSFIVKRTWLDTVEEKEVPTEEEPQVTEERREVITAKTGLDFPDNLIEVTVNILAKSEAIKNAVGEAGKTKRAADAMEEMLDPLLIRPVFTRTRCFICPM